MRNNINGISPGIAIVVTLIVAALTVWFYASGHIFWGIVFTLISIDFLADVILSLKKA